MSASYALNYTPTAGQSSTYATYQSASVKGTATGKASHQFGQSDFTIQLSDSGQAVDITCKNGGYSSSASSKNTLSVTMDTKAAYLIRKGASQPDYVRFSSFTFTEATQTNA